MCLGDSASSGCNLGDSASSGCLDRFIVSLCYVNELEAMELVLQLAYLLSVSLHFWVMQLEAFMT